MKSLSQKKGDEDLKNITYNIKEKRYVGRKQIKKHLIIVHGKTQLECKQKLKEKIDEFFNNKLVNVKQTITLSSFWDKWYSQDKEPFIAETTKKDILKIHKYLSPILENPINKVNKDMILNFFKTIKDSRIKEKMNLYLKACLKSAVNHGLIKKNPYDIIILAPKSNKHKDALTFEEQEKLFKYIENKKIGIIILIYLLTGLRKSELNFESIEKDINFENKTLKAINLKGRNNATRYKYIRLDSKFISMIMNSLDSIHSFNTEQAYREIYTLMRNLGIKKSVVNLRHTFATNHLYLGTPDYIISKEMGHSTSQITKDNYMNIDFNLNKEKIIKLYNNLYPIFN